MKKITVGRVAVERRRAEQAAPAVQPVAYPPTPLRASRPAKAGRLAPLRWHGRLRMTLFEIRCADGYCYVGIEEATGALHVYPTEADLPSNRDGTLRHWQYDVTPEQFVAALLVATAQVAS
jgi:hypothetical protein